MDKLDIRNLSVTVGKKEILHSVSLSVKAGELAALIGENGAGKTTLMRAVCGFVPYDGSIAVSGREMKKLDERRRARFVSYMPQVSGVGSGLTVMQTVLMGFTAQNGIFRTAGAVERRTALAYLQQMGLGEYADRDIGTLSAGERQLVIFCRSAVQKAPVLLLDEPDSALDFSNRVKLLSTVRDTVKQSGAAGLISLHDINFAFRHCDRVIALSGGSVKGEFRPKSDDREKIKSVLSAVYDGFDIIEQNGVPFMVPEETK